MATVQQVSVIIPTYNRAATLPRAIKSALSQTLPVHEIIICDDGSTDNSQEIVSALNDPKIKWIDCGRNGMPSVPRNKGINAATGTWIAFLDSDDEWLPEKNETQVKAMEQSGIKASTTNCFRIAGGKKLGAFLTHTQKKITFADLLNENLNICSSVIISRKLLINTSLFPEAKEYKAYEDYALWLRIALKTAFCYLEKPLINYYDDPSSSIRSGTVNEQKMRLFIFEELQTWMKEKRIESNIDQLQVAIEKARKPQQISWISKLKNKLRG